jgi:hypothetical protein
LSNLDTDQLENGDFYWTIARRAAWEQPSAYTRRLLELQTIFAYRLAEDPGPLLPHTLESLVQIQNQIDCETLRTAFTIYTCLRDLSLSRILISATFADRTAYPLTPEHRAHNVWRR